MQEKEITSIKFFWNGFKLNGSKSLSGKVFYEFVNDEHANNISGVKLIDQISKGIYPHIDVIAHYCDLPDCIFWNVENDSDVYTDYYDDDSACVSPDHPLYKYILYAAAQAKIHDLKSSIAYNQKRLTAHKNAVIGSQECIQSSIDYYQRNLNEAKKNLAAFQKIENPGHPSEAEVAECIELYSQKCEQERHAAELKEQQEREEQHRKFEAEKAETSKILSKDIERYPLSDDDPYYVQFLWSECPAFYNLCDDRPENKKVLKTSIEAAEHIAKDLDEYYNPLQARPHSYEKTAFEIYSKAGEKLWEGRLDLGDELGGLFTHLQSWADGLRKYAGQFGIKTKEQDLKDADDVEEFIAELKRSIHKPKPATVYKIDLKSFTVA